MMDTRKLSGIADERITFIDENEKLIIKTTGSIIKNRGRKFKAEPEQWLLEQAELEIK